LKKKSEYTLTSTHWGTYRVESKQGQVVAMHPFEEDSDPSPIGNGIIDVIDAPSRIRKPAVRKSWLDSGPGSKNDLRGVDPFVEVSWTEAETLVADELQRVKTVYGNKGIYAGSYGWSSAGRFHHAQSQIHRFLKCIGGYTRSVNTYSFASAEVILPHVIGDLFSLLLQTTSWPSVIESSSLIVALGGIPMRNGQINSGGIGQHVQRDHIIAARKAGIEFVNVAPIASDIENDIDCQWIPIRPGSDAALLISLAYILHHEGLSDNGFIDQFTKGFDVFLNYLNGVGDGIKKDALWAADICNVPANDIVDLARRMATNRTMLSISWSLTRQHHGEHIYWAAVTVAALLGQIGLPGGGIGFGYSTTNGIGAHNTKIPGASLPQGDNLVPDFIPVARISDMLLNPGATFDYNGQTGIYPDIQLVYWAGGNPFHHHQDLNRMRRAWQKPDTVIVHDWCWNSSAKFADIVLPCTTALERNDISISPRDPYVISMQKAIEPVDSSRNDYDIFRGIAGKMGIELMFTEDRDEAQWLEWIYKKTVERAKEKEIDFPDYDDFRELEWFKPDAPKEPVVMLEHFRKDPVKYPLSTPSGKIEIYSENIAKFNYDDCPGHPTWMEPAEWLGGDLSEYPLHLITNQPKTKLHSQLDHGSHSRNSKIQQREPLLINPNDASERGLVEGDVVKVFNARGACLAGIIVSDEIMPGVVQMSTGAWYDPVELSVEGSLCKHGNVNVLTADFGTSKLAQGPSALTCLVNVELYDQELPVVTAFDPPEILKRTGK